MNTNERCSGRSNSYLFVRINGYCFSSVLSVASVVEKLQTRCVVVGGGPAGMMAGYLLARAGVQVAVLEKHADFNRDFRGDTIHPSTLQLMYELGLLDEFLKQPHQELRELRAMFNGQVVPAADFTQLPTR